MMKHRSCAGPWPRWRRAAAARAGEEGPGRRIITSAAVPENLVDCVLKLDVAMDAIEPAGFADEVASIEMVIDFIEKLKGVAADG